MLQVSIRKRLVNGTQSRNGTREQTRERAFMLDVDFDAPEGVTILFGPSGSGKTTILRSIAGIVVPDEGRISLNNRPYFDSASGLNLPIQQRRVGFMFQDHILFPHMTAEQNVVYGIRPSEAGGQSKAAKRERARELLALLGIEYAARQYPRELSGGESQRVALARALASDPAIVLLDEPLSAVDQKTRERLLAEISETQKRAGVPFLYVTHNTAEAATIGDHAIVLDDGKVIRRVSPKELMHDQRAGTGG
jgi:molybdate transport system ATP-binding protein